MTDKTSTDRSDGRRILWWLAGAVSVLCLAGWLLGIGAGGPEAGRGLTPFVLFLSLLRDLIRPLVISAIIFLSAASAGNRLLGMLRARPPHPASAFVFATGTGLGIFSTLTLVLGYLGWLNGAVFWSMAAALFLSGGRPFAQHLGDLGRATSRRLAELSTSEWFLLALAAGFVALLLLCAGTPIMDYDTLEYHLGAPGQYYAHGRIHFLDNNVYAAFPQHVEMLYLGGIVLSQSKAVGAGAAILTQGMFGVVTAIALARLAGHALSCRCRMAAGLFFLSCPLLVVSVTRAHITLARCFYLTLALLAVVRWTSTAGAAGSPPEGTLESEKASERSRSGWIILAGLSAGLAAAVKYPALLMICLPLGVYVLTVGVLREKTWKERLRPAALLSLCALVSVGPWLIRNFAATGNPFFPLLYEIFGGDGWPAHQAAKFAAAHAASPVGGPQELMRELWQFLIGFTDAMSPGFAGPLVLVFVPFVFLSAADGQRKKGNRTLILLGAYGIVYALLWAFFTHRIDRFLSPLLVPLAILSAAGFCLLIERKTLRPIGMITALVLGGCLLWFQAVRADTTGALGGTLSGESRADLTRGPGMEFGRAYVDAVDWINSSDNVSRGARVMLVGEARIYPFDRDLLYSVVFNDHPIELSLRLLGEDPAAAVAELRRTGADYVLVNWPELRRLSTSYRYRYNGRTRPGYLPQVDWRTRQPLTGLLEAAGTRVRSFGAVRWPTPDSPESIPIIEIYRINVPR